MVVRNTAEEAVTAPEEDNSSSGLALLGVNIHHYDCAVLSGPDSSLVLADMTVVGVDAYVVKAPGSLAYPASDAEERIHVCFGNAVQ